jgi:hypothetical protein
MIQHEKKDISRFTRFNTKEKVGHDLHLLELAPPLGEDHDLIVEPLPYFLIVTS